MPVYKETKPNLFGPVGWAAEYTDNKNSDGEAPLMLEL